MPLDANANTIARPMPRLPPVTKIDEINAHWGRVTALRMMGYMR